MTFEPLRPGRLGAVRLQEFLRAEGLGDKEVQQTLQHVAGAKRESQFTDAAPMIEMAFDHGSGGAYETAFELFPDKKVPVGLGIVDNHPTNLGAVPLHGAPGEPVVYGVTDATHAGEAPLTWDMYRGAHTHAGTARGNGLGETRQGLVALAFARAVLAGLRDYATSGERPPAYLRAAEVKGKATRKLLEKAGRTDANAAVVVKFTGSREGTRLKPKYKIGDEALYKELKREFAAQYAALLPAGLKGQVTFLDAGMGRNVGGSNSELPHFYVLARFGSEPRVVEIKQLIPCPAKFTTGSPALADAAGTVAAAKRIQPSENPLMLPFHFRGREYVAVPYDRRVRELDLSQLDTKKKLIAMATNNGLLTARVLAQSLDAGEVRELLEGVDPRDWASTVQDYAMTYVRQAGSDAAGVEQLLAN